MTFKFMRGHHAGISACFAIGALAAAACSSSSTTPQQAADTGPIQNVTSASDVPIDGVDADTVRQFEDGDDLFDLAFREPDGLGPLYTRSSCGACHDGAARGPGLVQKMSVVEADGITASADQSKLPYGHTIKQGLAAGAKTPILAPPNDPTVKVTTRLGPPVLGRGYMEAIADSEIERMESEQSQRTDGIHGHVNRVTYASQPNVDTSFFDFQFGQTNLIGRFGIKARQPSIDDFVADAFQGDMGLTTPMRPTEPVNPDGLTDDDRTGVDLPIDHVNRIAFYIRRIAIPPRVGLTDQGKALFDQVSCSVCHAPSLKTRSDYPITELAGIDAPVYTDMLVHDMGPHLADGMVDGTALGSEFRTAPLIGLRFSKTFLHDGRVTSVDAAIRAHEGEAQKSADAYAALSDADRQTLLQFVQAL